MKITHVLFKNPGRAMPAASPTNGLDCSNFPIETFVHPELGPHVRYAGSPWAIPMSNVACIAYAEEPKPEPKAKK